MNPWNILRIVMIFMVFFIENQVSAQCNIVGVKPIKNIGLDFIELELLELIESDGWQVKYWPVSSPSDSIYTDSLVLDSYTIQDLSSATEYVIFVRNLCLDNQSGWNGPYSPRTLISNNADDNTCRVRFNINDDHCPSKEHFSILVEDLENEILGEDVFLSNVQVIIKHTWPADLRLSLMSPDSIEVELSRDVGINRENYGDPFDGNCNQTVQFDMSACKSIDQIDQSMVGSYIPLGDFTDFYNGNSPNGIWNLKICDKASGDLGQLKYLKLNFSPIICNVPTDIGIETVTDNSITISWENIEVCDRVVLQYGPSGFLPGTGKSVGIQCPTSTYLIDQLEPNTTYDFFLQTRCQSFNAMSSKSCRFSFVTDCHQSSYSSTFDDEMLCDQSCVAQCPLQDEVWHNIDFDDMDWIVNRNQTPSSQTGPEMDVFNIGNYLYIENTNTLCAENSKAILESGCMMVVSNQDGCDMHFNYHMNGTDINQLILILSKDNFISWDTLVNLSGNHGDQWNQLNIDLSQFAQEAVVFRFIAYSSEGEFGDIAIDNIHFYGTEVLQESLIYYYDNDNDGYGDATITTRSCNAIPPIGYVSNPDDCNDSDFFIHPNAVEVYCNLIDENCNGNFDDQPVGNPIRHMIVTSNTKNVYCDGIMDGKLEIKGLGGTPPYQYHWDNGVDSSFIDSLSAGTYFCTITDADSCKYVTSPIHIVANNQFEIQFDVNSPSCIGRSDGEIIVDHVGGGVFTYEWSNGTTEKKLVDIPEGEYWVEITSTFNQYVCTEKDSVIVISPQVILFDTIITDISCNGLKDGKISILPYNGSEPYEYDWGGGNFTNTITEIGAGKYQCTILDANNCIHIIDSLEMIEPEPLTIRLDKLNHVICKGEDNGLIRISPVGGTAPFTYQWSNGGFVKQIDTLSAGNYTITVMDDNFCVNIIHDIEILEKPEMIVSIDSSHNVSCPLSFDGYIKMKTLGGSGVYNYFWKHTSIDTNTLYNLESGDYTLQVVDELGCKVKFESNIPLDNIPLEIATDIYVNNKCANDELAGIRSIVPNGTKPFQFHWSNGQIDTVNIGNADSIQNLTPGQYSVSVRDSAGCVAVSSLFEIELINELNYNLVDWSDPSCFGVDDGYFEVAGVGGTAPYSFLWNNNGFVGDKNDNLGTGDYSFTLKDINDCSILSAEFELESPEKITLEIIIEYNSINGKSHIRIQAMKGNAPYRFVWNDLYQDTGFISDRNNLPLIEYNISIIDNMGCQIDTTITTEDIVYVPQIHQDISAIIFPNPTLGSFQLIVNGIRSKGKSIVNIRNTLGEIVFSDQFNTSEAFSEMIQIDHLTQGVLFLEFFDPSQQLIFNEKIILIK